MPSDQNTSIPAVPLRTDMFDGPGMKDLGNLTRTWIIFFERNFTGSGTAASGEGSRVYNWGLGQIQDIAVGTTLTDKLTIQFPGYAVRWSITANTAPTGTSIVIDIKKNNTSIFRAGNANKIVLPAGSIGPIEGTSFLTDPYPFVHLDILTVDVLQVGSTVPGFKVHVELVVSPR